MKKLLATILALVMALGVTTISWADTPAEMDLDAFIRAVVAANYNYDGNGVTVKMSPVSGCLGNNCSQTHEGEHDTVRTNENVPEKVNSDLAQFIVFSGSDKAVTIKNVKFVYEAKDFTLWGNTNFKGEFKADVVKSGQLYLESSGDVTFTGCTFDRVVLTSWKCSGTSTVTNCEFYNVYNSYAIKDIRGANINVTGCTIKDCGGGIMVSQTSADTAVQTVNISNNAFENVDSESTAASGKAGTRGLIQLASSGKYDTAAITLNENFADGNCGPVLRQLNDTADISKVQGDLSGLLDGEGKLTTTGDTSDGNKQKVNNIAVHTVRFNMNGHGDDFYKQIADGTTITLFAPNSGNSNIVFKNWTANGQTYNADDTYEVKGNVEFTAVWQDNTPAPRYYYSSTTTDTKTDTTKGSPKTFDAGIGIYALTAVLSVTGMAWTAKKRH